MENYIYLYQTDELEKKEKIVKYLTHCGRDFKEETDTMETEEGETLYMYRILIAEKDQQEAARDVAAVLSYEDKENGEEKPKKKKREPHVSDLYMDAGEKAKEFKSSGYMFLGFAAVFFVFGLLNAFKIVTIMSAPTSLVILFMISAVFVAIGTSSLKSVSSLKEKAGEEKKTTDAILAYLHDAFPKETLDAMRMDEESEEQVYFLFTEAMKKAVNEEFPGQAENYVDALLEDYYNSLEN